MTDKPQIEPEIEAAFKEWLKSPDDEFQLSAKTPRDFMLADYRAGYLRGKADGIAEERARMEKGEKISLAEFRKAVMGE